MTRLIELLKAREEGLLSAAGGEILTTELIRENEQLTNLLMDTADHLEGCRPRADGNAPGHGHEVPGIWDADNGEKSGQPCYWCSTWRRIVAKRAEIEAARV